MKEYVLDANAVTRYLGASKGGGLEKVDDLIELARQDRVILLMSVVNLGEAGYVLLKNSAWRRRQEPSGGSRIRSEWWTPITPPP